MKILHTITSLELGGAEKLLTELIPAQIAMGHEAELLILCDKNAVFMDNFKLKNIPVHVSKYNSIKTWKNMFQIKKYAKKGKFDVVHSHLTHAQYWTSLASRIDFGKRIYITTEHSTSNNRRQKFIFKLIDRFIYKPYKKIISISPATQEELIKWIGGNKKRFEIIENGVDLSRFSQGNKIDLSEYGLDTDDKIIIMISRFHKAKDQDTVIKSLEFLPKIYKLVLVGDGERREELEKFTSEKNLSSRVFFLGIRKDIPDLLKTSYVAVQSSIFEGFGITALESMSAGIPTIATDVPGLSAIVKGGGILFPVGDYKKLAKIIFSLERNDMYNKIKNSCIEKSKMYDIKITAEKYINLYSSLISGGK
ncbi:glycosyltransferase [Fusobacterium perfoetens]|uniref:glycosyltransferase n=1 Tax=Fusobacterium perfoetens TaxID=852 RepID=UPI001F28DE24|nr:glycosyltransferase [Fusobacterium perfoetens]MCF2624581.1 glycosyltransferase [Fusobacterium perfoetens]